jgi:hypothetical protein
MQLSLLMKVLRQYNRDWSAHGVHLPSLLPKNLLEPLSIVFTQIRIGATLMPRFPKVTEGCARHAGPQRVLREHVFCRVVSNDISDEADDIPVAVVERLCPEIRALDLGEVTREFQVGQIQPLAGWRQMVNDVFRRSFRGGGSRFRLTFRAWIAGAGIVARMNLGRPPIYRYARRGSRMTCQIIATA